MDNFCGDNEEPLLGSFNERRPKLFHTTHIMFLAFQKARSTGQGSGEKNDFLRILERRV